jgi:aminoglycoside N3'-acetyltransferase
MKALKAGIKDVIRPVVNNFRTALREHHIKRTAPRIGKQQIVTDLGRLGISPGDVVFLHSSLKSIGYVEGGAHAVLQALLDVITLEGTVIVPTYYMPGGTIHAACREKDYVFDPRVHGSGLGAIPDAFLQLSGIERSIHPTHSVSALGKRARYVTEAHHRAPSTFGTGSPWQRCVELGGKVLGLGVSMGPVTFYHLLEDAVGDEFPLPIKLRETYYLKCRDWSNHLVEVPVRPFDPQYVERRIDSKGREDLRQYFWKEFERAGLLSVGKVGQALSWVMNARSFYDHLYNLMKQNITIYSTPDQIRQRPLD